jgi:hypothetical protein
MIRKWCVKGQIPETQKRNEEMLAEELVMALKHLLTEGTLRFNLDYRPTDTFDVGLIRLEVLLNDEIVSDTTTYL